MSLIMITPSLMPEPYIYLYLLLFSDGKKKKIRVFYLPNLVFCVVLSLSGYLKAPRREKLRN